MKHIEFTQQKKQEHTSLLTFLCLSIFNVDCNVNTSLNDTIVSCVVPIDIPTNIFYSICSSMFVVKNFFLCVYNTYNLKKKITVEAEYFKFQNFKFSYDLCNSMFKFTTIVPLSLFPTPKVL